MAVDPENSVIAYLFIRVNGVLERAKQHVPTLTPDIVTTTLIHMNAGDYVEAIVYQASGDDAEIELKELSAIRIAP